MLLLAPALTPLHVRSRSARSTAWSCTARCGWRSREPRPATSWRRTPITRRDRRMLGLTAPCRHFFSCRAARASASRAPTDTACAGASGPSRRRSSSVPPAGARMYREGRGGERSRRGVSCVRRRLRRPAGCGIRLRSATRCDCREGASPAAHLSPRPHPHHLVSGAVSRHRDCRGDRLLHLAAPRAQPVLPHRVARRAVRTHRYAKQVPGHRRRHPHPRPQGLSAPHPEERHALPRPRDRHIPVSHSHGPHRPRS